MKRLIFLFSNVHLFCELMVVGHSSIKIMQVDSIWLTNQFRHEMTCTEVESLMGKSKLTQIVGEQLVIR